MDGYKAMVSLIHNHDRERENDPIMSPTIHPSTLIERYPAKVRPKPQPKFRGPLQRSQPERFFGKDAGQPIAEIHAIMYHLIFTIF